MTAGNHAKTRALLATYVRSSSIYLSAQALLIVLSWWLYVRDNIATFGAHSTFLFWLGISAFLVTASYWILRKWYRPEKVHYLLHAISWCVLFLPQTVPMLRHGLSIIYPTWTVILATTATGTIVFQDLLLVDVEHPSGDAARFMYDELRFYLDKLFIAILTLGTGVGVMMTILWTAPEQAFEMTEEQREFWAVYMLLCLLAVGVMLAVLVIYPILTRYRTVRTRLLEPQPETDGSRGTTRIDRIPWLTVVLVGACVAFLFQKWLRAFRRLSAHE